MTDDRLQRIKLLAMDVDGVLTRGDIIYGDTGAAYKFFHGDPVAEHKVFNILDGLGISVARDAGLLTAIVTGRKSGAVARRAKELKVTVLCEGCRDKGGAIRDLRERFNLPAEEVAFIGDDINDIPAFRESGVRFAVANACVDVKAQADYVTELPGGEGAVREVIELILRTQGKWDAAVESFLRSLKQPG